MYETDTELEQLQRLLDDSLARSTQHLRSIVVPGASTLTAPQLTSLLTGMRTLVLSTVTAKGEPRVSGVDGHLWHGRWIFGTSLRAAKARHLRARPAVSAAYLEGEALGVFVHGIAETLYAGAELGAPDWPPLHEYLRGFYGDDAFDWSDIAYYRLRPTWMVAYAADPDALLARADRQATAAAV